MVESTQKTTTGNRGLIRNFDPEQDKYAFRVYERGDPRFDHTEAFPKFERPLTPVYAHNAPEKRGRPKGFSKPPKIAEELKAWPKEEMDAIQKNITTE